MGNRRRSNEAKHRGSSRHINLTEDAPTINVACVIERILEAEERPEKPPGLNPAAGEKPIGSGQALIE